MALLHETRLDNTIPSGAIGIGEHVDVRTKLGSHVASGIVYGSTPFGIILKEGESAHNFYSEKLYIFSVHEPDVEVRAASMLADLSLDDRVDAKLKAIAEKNGNSGNGNGTAPDEEQGGEEPENGNDAGDEGGEKQEPDSEAPAQSGNEPVATDEPEIDPDMLPDDIKDAIIDPQQMDVVQLNKFMSEISDVAIKSLKKSGVKEQKIFAVVQKMQKSIYKILTGKALKK